MRKYLVVGVGGSGGATVRYVMDQLRADLRSHSVDELPAAWQFLHIDVNPVPEQTPGLGSIRDLGGTYVPVSVAGNTFRSVRGSVEERLTRADRVDGLLGWSPSPREQADNVPVGEGAGQFRSVGRMLTLTRLDDIQGALNRSWQALQQATAWGQLPAALPDQGPYDAASVVLPIVVGSMAGGSGASMFLDVCRVLGRIPTLDTKNLGVFLFTPDVFSSLDEFKRRGIDGNALAALGEIGAAQTTVGNRPDHEILEALGMSRESSSERAFGRVFPIGQSIGGDGARFGDTADDVFRGLGRALAATISSEAASEDYQKTRFQNPTGIGQGREVLGWGDDTDIDGNCWGSFGYASFSLGRDRYAEYAAQRLSRTAVDALLDGFRNEGSAISPNDELDRLVANQWPTILTRLGLPPRGGGVRDWLQSGPLGADQRRRMALAAVGPQITAVRSVTARKDGKTWLDAVQERLSGEQQLAAEAIRRESYAFAEEFADAFEQRVRDEVLRWLSNPRQGLPFARRCLERLNEDLAVLVEGLGKATPLAVPLAVDAGQADAVRQAAVSETIIADVSESLLGSARRALTIECALLLSAVLKSFIDDVVPTMRAAVINALENLSAARSSMARQAGLAQLHTAMYNEWPRDHGPVPPRFEHALNEILLTTSDDFPRVFDEHLRASSPENLASAALDNMVEEIVRGRWQSTGAEQTEYPVLVADIAWRAPVLATDAKTGSPTPPNPPAYRLSLSTADILDRALVYQQRKDYPFARFSDQTFNGYLREVGISDAESDRRRLQFVEKFEEAAKQAYPLVGVNRAQVEALHGVPLQVELWFTDVPLEAGSPAATAVRERLDGIADLDTQTSTRFDKALSPNSRAARIAIYGGYPKYFPIVFSSFLRQLSDRWANESEEGKGELWKWKRTRPLPASIWMSASEQAAMIKGWYLGRALGHIALRSEGPTVQVYDPRRAADAHGGWLRFATGELTPHSLYRDRSFDWLPGVLEAHTLALANTANDPTFASLRPYQALRRIYDDGINPSVTGSTRGASMVEAWVRSGEWTSGMPTEIDLLRLAGDSPQERGAALERWLAEVRQYVERTYLEEPTGPGVLARWRSRVHHVGEVDRSPMFAEIALQVRAALEDLEKVVRDVVVSIQRDGEPGGKPQA